MFENTSSYANLTTIVFPATINAPRLECVERMFAGNDKITNLEIHMPDSASLTNMSSMFSGNISLVDLTVDINTSSATNMSSMFSNCSSLEEIDLSTFNTNSVTNFDSMFAGCTSLESLNLSNFSFKNPGPSLGLSSTAVREVYLPSTFEMKNSSGTVRDLLPNLGRWRRLYDAVEMKMDDSKATYTPASLADA